MLTSGHRRQPLVQTGRQPKMRPISAWEPLIVAGGQELATDQPQLVRDALA